MRVQWKTFNDAAFMYASDHYPEDTRAQDFEKELEGEVLFVNRTFWGTVVFIVKQDDGQLISVKATECTVIDK